MQLDPGLLERDKLPDLWPGDALDIAKLHSYFAGGHAIPVAGEDPIIIPAAGATVVDATCPFVKKMHRQARRLFKMGYRVVIVGDRNHSEITSLTEDPSFACLVAAGIASTLKPPKPPK